MSIWILLCSQGANCSISFKKSTVFRFESQRFLNSPKEKLRDCVFWNYISPNCICLDFYLKYIYLASVHTNSYSKLYMEYIYLVFRFETFGAVFYVQSLRILLQFSMVRTKFQTIITWYVLFFKTG